MKQFVKKVLSKADADAYAKAKFSVQARNADAKKWWSDIAAIKENGWYLSEFATFKEWCEKYSAWAPGTIRMALSNARKAKSRRLITETTGEVIISIAQSAPTQNQSATQLRGNTTPPENNTNLSNGVVEDANGCQIPAHALQYWKEKQDVQDMLTAISEVRSHIRKKVEAGDKLWIDKSATQRLQVDLDSVYTIIKNFMPYAVCTVCQGHVANGSCDSCHGTGLVSEFHYKHFSDKRSIAIRQGERANVRA
jgi:hypothetical protein